MEGSASGTCGFVTHGEGLGLQIPRRSNTLRMKPTWILPRRKHLLTRLHMSQGVDYGLVSVVMAL